MANEIRPICQAMVLCDGLHQNPFTWRISLLDTIGNNLTASEFPQSWPSIAVYLVLTSGHGSNVLTLRWIGPDDELLPGSEQHQEIEFSNPLDTWEVYFYCHDLIFPLPGEYRVELSVAGDIVEYRRLFVFA